MHPKQLKKLKVGFECKDFDFENTFKNYMETLYRCQCPKCREWFMLEVDGGFPGVVVYLDGSDTECDL